MSRIRTVKPEFFRSRSLARVTREARLTFIGLWCEADDLGRGVADTRLLKGSIWPLDDDMTPVDIEEHLSELADAHIALYWCEGERFYEVQRFDKHQAAAYRRGESRHPAPPDPPEPEPLHDKKCKEVRDAHEGVLEGKGRDRKGTDDVPVTEEGTPDVPSSSLKHQRQVDEVCNRYANAVMARPENHGKESGWRRGIVLRTGEEQGFAILEALETGMTPTEIVERMSAGLPILEHQTPPSDPSESRPLEPLFVPLPKLTDDEKAAAAVAAAEVRTQFRRRHLEVLQGEGETA